MKKRFTEEEILGFLREAEAGMPIAELCRKHAFSGLDRNKYRADLEQKPLAANATSLIPR